MIYLSFIFPKIRGNIHGRDYTYVNGVDEPTNFNFKEIIDPFARETLITNGYKAKKMPSRKINMSDKSAFADYEFYYLPEVNGAIIPDSIVMAERYYKNKDEQDSDSIYGNATYLFKFKDLARIFNKSSNEIERINKTNCDKSAVRLNHGKNWAKRFRRKVIKN